MSRRPRLHRPEEIDLRDEQVRAALAAQQNAQTASEPTAAAPQATPQPTPGTCEPGVSASAAGPAASSWHDPVTPTATSPVVPTAPLPKRRSLRRPRQNLAPGNRRAVPAATTPISQLEPTHTAGHSASSLGAADPDLAAWAPTSEVPVVPTATTAPSAEPPTEQTVHPAPPAPQPPPTGPAAPPAGKPLSTESPVATAQPATQLTSAGEAKPQLTDARIPLVAVIAALLLGLILGVTVGASFPDSDQQRAKVDNVDAVLFTEGMECGSGHFVAFIGAAKPPHAEALAVGMLYHEVANAQRRGVAADKISLSNHEQVCAHAAVGYTTLAPGNFYTWAGPFASEAEAVTWCQGAGKADLAKQCIIKPTK